MSDRKMPILPPKAERTEDPEPTDEDLDGCLQALGSRKAAGKDAIPKEVLQSSPDDLARGARTNKNDRGRRHNDLQKQRIVKRYLAIPRHYVATSAVEGIEFLLVKN